MYYKDKGQIKSYWAKSDTNDEDSRLTENVYGGQIPIDGHKSVQFSLGVINSDRRKANKAGKFKITA